MPDCSPRSSYHDNESDSDDDHAACPRMTLAGDHGATLDQNEVNSLVLETLTVIRTLVENEQVSGLKNDFLIQGIDLMGHNL